MFRFKQFSILQDKSAMKVGTDGVLLGAWTPVKNATSILDVGTGTGLIALMLAQRTLNAHIDAVEVEDEAYVEATINFKNAPWSDRLKIYKDSFLEFQTDCKYDLIVSNPPYYTDTYKQPSSERMLARHVGELTFKSLLEKVAGLLSEQGTCAFIIPYKEEESFLKLGENLGLFPKKIERIKGRVDLPFKRSLLYLTQELTSVEEKELVIEKGRHIYTDEYIKLTKLFYLKM